MKALKNLASVIGTIILIVCLMALSCLGPLIFPPIIQPVLMGTFLVWPTLFVCKALYKKGRMTEETLLYALFFSWMIGILIIFIIIGSLFG